MGFCGRRRTWTRRNAVVGLVLAGLLGGCECKPDGQTGDAAEIGDADAESRWVRSFPEEMTCTSVDVRGAVHLPGAFGTRDLAMGERRRVAFLGWGGDRGYLLYAGGEEDHPGEPSAIRDLFPDGTVGEPRVVQRGSWCHTGMRSSRSAGMFLEGRFRVVFGDGSPCVNDPELLEPMLLYFIGEIDVAVPANIDSSIRYINGIGQRYPSPPWPGWHFEFHGGRLFLETKEWWMYTIGEINPDWGGDWNNPLLWYRWQDVSPFYPTHDGDVTMLGDKYVFAWVGRDMEVGNIRLVLGIGHRPLAPDEREPYEHQRDLDELLLETDTACYDCPSWVRLVAGERTVAVFRQDWAQLFDAELNEVGAPVNFGPHSDYGDDVGDTQGFYGGGYYAFVHESSHRRTGGWLDEGLAVTFVDESGNVASRKVLSCGEVEAEPDYLPYTVSIDVQDAVWTGSGFWMVFAADVPDRPPESGDRDLRLIFVPAP